MYNKKINIGTALVIIFLGLAPQSIQANDSSAALEAGGLVLTKTEKIAMESETLIIRPNDILVNYQFRNKTHKPLKIRIAFPLPDIPFEEAYYNHPSFPVDDPLNFVGFKTIVDGEAIKMVSTHQIWANNKNITDDYLKFGFPVSMADNRFFQKANSDQGGVFLKKFGTMQSSDIVQRTLYHWEQTFPAQKAVHVSHSYKPVAGNQPVYHQEFIKMLKRGWREEYCIDDMLAKKILAAFDSGKEKKLFNYTHQVDYILTTGNNWKGGIGAFRLRVEPGKTFTHAVFCSPDGTGGLFGKTLEMRYSDFQPQKDLKVLYFGAYR